MVVVVAAALGQLSFVAVPLGQLQFSSHRFASRLMSAHAEGNAILAKGNLARQPSF